MDPGDQVVIRRGFRCLARCGRYLIAGEYRYRYIDAPARARGFRPEILPSTIFVWDLTSGKLAGILSGHSNDIRSIAMSPDGRYLLSSGGESGGDVRLWELNLPR